MDYKFLKTNFILHIFSYEFEFIRELKNCDTLCYI